jgi:hypothetical protein
MASADGYEVIVEKVLYDLARSYGSCGDVRTLMSFDRARGQFLLIDEGWEGYQRTYAVWAHVELTDGKLRIHEDGTEVGIANLLVSAGVPKQNIVLTFHAPNLRGATEFAAA